MMQRKCLIVYVSGTSQSTKKLVDEWAKNHLVKVVTIREFFQEDLTQYNVIGLGSGIYFQRQHSAILKFAKKLPEGEKEVFIFSTYGIPLTFICHYPLKRILKSKGYKVFGEFSCGGKVTLGFLNKTGGLFPHRPSNRSLAKARLILDEILNNKNRGEISE